MWEQALKIGVNYYHFLVKLDHIQIEEKMRFFLDRAVESFD